MNFIRKNIYIFIILFLIFINMVVLFRLNIFRYNNFDHGKFDLGNMTQMAWNTLNGRFMYLTDYFGTNMPRWGMSHVDPILVIFLPIFALIPHPLTLVFSQIILVLATSLIIYKIGVLELKSKALGCVMAVSYLLYPAVGYLNAVTGYHGVTAAMFFFTLSFYFFEKMYFEKAYTKKNMIIFIFSSIITMSGKEQIPLYYIMFSFFIFFFRNYNYPYFKFDKKRFSLESTKIAVGMFVVSAVWFYMAFMVIIPKNAHYRIEGYKRFADSINLSSGEVAVDLDNYFLSRYDAFGDSYLGIVFGMIKDHRLALRIFFGGDKPDNLSKTFTPVLYAPFFHPFSMLMAFPDIFINYMTSQEDVGTSEIVNHRISMIVPVVFISTILALKYVEDLLRRLKIKDKFITVFKIGLSAGILFVSYRTIYAYNNPVYLWLDQSIRKRVSARYEKEVLKEDLKIGDVVKLTELDNKDISCANMIVKIVPDDVSVSGPDYLGAHLSMRETYAIFPALFNEADFVVVDVFSQKISNILGVRDSLAKDALEKVLKDPNYVLTEACGNLFVFEKEETYEKETMLPIQEKYLYEEKVNYEIFNGLYVVDYEIPEKVERKKPVKSFVTYTIRDKNTFDNFVLYMTYVNKKDGKVYQAANLPSFAFEEPSSWTKNLYYKEYIDIAIPEYVEPGDYLVFIGISNKIKIRNVYLGDMIVE